MKDDPMDRIVTLVARLDESTPYRPEWDTRDRLELLARLELLRRRDAWRTRRIAFAMWAVLVAVLWWR